MVECCCAHLNEPSLASLTQSAIEAGNINFFVQQATRPNGRSLIAELKIIYEFHILEYCVRRNQTNLFFYLLDSTSGWADHIKPLLRHTPLRMHVYAMNNGNTRIIQYLFNDLKKPEEMVNMEFCGDMKKTLLHFMAQYCNANHNEMYQLLSSYAGVKERQLWLDANGNTPLHDAAKVGNLASFKFFVEMLHFSPLRVNDRGKNAFDCIEGEDLKKYAKDWLNRYRGVVTLSERSFYLPIELPNVAIANTQNASSSVSSPPILS